MQREKTGIKPENVRRFLLVVMGSVFVQVFCWAVYSYLSLNIWMCGLSVIVTALLYHFIQTEEETGLPRYAVFLAAILLPFVIALTISVIHFVRYPQLSLLGADLDGVSALTETVSLYAARLTINGVLLCVFAGIDRAFRKGKGNKEEQQDENIT